VSSKSLEEHRRTFLIDAPGAVSGELEELRRTFHIDAPGAVSGATAGAPGAGAPLPMTSDDP
jgi:hypothetical protein